MGAPRTRVSAAFAILAIGVGIVLGGRFASRAPEETGRTEQGPGDAGRPGGDLAGRGSAAKTPEAPSDETAAAPEPPEPTDPAPRPEGWPADAPTLSCRVQIVDAVTGAPIEKRWHLHTPSQAPAPPPLPGQEAVPEVEPRPEPPRYDGRVRAPTDVAALRHDGADEVTHCIPEVDLPDGDYVQWERLDGWSVVAAGVESVQVRVPLRRAATLEVEVVGPTSAPAQGARLSQVRLDGRVLESDSWGPARYDVDERGVATIRGVPIVPGAHLQGFVTWADATAVGTEPEPAEPATPPLRLVVPSVVPSPWRTVVRLAGPTRPGDDAATEADLAGAMESDNDVPEGPVPRGSAVVRATGWDGRALADVRVYAPGASGTTGRDGLVRFDGLAAGPATFSLDARDRFHAVATATVREGAVASVALVEPEGGRLELLVVDEDHRPCPTARIDVQTAFPPSWFDVDGVVQRLDPFTDENGRRTIVRVAPGRATVWATAAGERSARAQIEVRDRSTQSLTLVVRGR